VKIKGRPGRKFGASVSGILFHATGKRPLIFALKARKIEELTGRFTSAEEVVGAALEQLRLENFGNFDTGELDGFIAAGEADIESGDVLSVKQVRENLGHRSAKFRRSGSYCRV
jgi:hypothetical protein